MKRTSPAVSGGDSDRAHHPHQPPAAPRSSTHCAVVPPITGAPQLPRPDRFATQTPACFCESFAFSNQRVSCEHPCRTDPPSATPKRPARSPPPPRRVRPCPVRHPPTPSTPAAFGVARHPPRPDPHPPTVIRHQHPAHPTKSLAISPAWCPSRVKNRGISAGLVRFLYHTKLSPTMVRIVGLDVLHVVTKTPGRAAPDPRSPGRATPGRLDVLRLIPQPSGRRQSSQ